MKAFHSDKHYAHNGRDDRGSPAPQFLRLQREVLVLSCGHHTARRLFGLVLRGTRIEGA
jgi:hypothetical protein